jgi:hypothetical protein
MRVLTHITRGVIGGAIVALLLVPLAVGYLTAPCEVTGEPLVLSPHRVRQRQFLTEATTWHSNISDVSAMLQSVLNAPQPGSVSAAFRVASEVGKVSTRLDLLTPPEAPPEYVLLAGTMHQARDDYAYGIECLLSFYGSSDSQALLEAQAALRLGDAALSDVAAGIEALTYPLCREVWRDR